MTGPEPASLGARPWIADRSGVAAFTTGLDLSLPSQLPTVELRRDHARAMVAELCQFLEQDQQTNIGFPARFDLDTTDLEPVNHRLLNNIGDPFHDSAFPANTHPFERQVIAWFARLLRAPADDWWGYVTGGSAEAIAFALHRAHALLPSAVVYHSTEAHFSVAAWAHVLGLRTVAVAAEPAGAIDVGALADAVTRRRGRPAIVVATIGTTMTEAVDDVAGIHSVLDQAGVPGRWVHADAALAGIPLALLPDGQRPPFTLDHRVDSASVSGLKFLGTKQPTGVIVTRRSLVERHRHDVDYLRAAVSTLSSSRSGHGPLQLWYALLVHGDHGLRTQAQHARTVAACAVERLTAAGLHAWRHPHALTVVFDRPAEPIRVKWRLATSGPISHLVCTPSVTTGEIDALCADICPPPIPASDSTPAPFGAATRPVPRQRPSRSQERPAGGSSVLRAAEGGPGS